MRILYIVPSLNKPSGWRSHALGLLHAIGSRVDPVLVVTPDNLAAARALFPGASLRVLPAIQDASLGSLRGGRALLQTWRQIGQMDIPDVDLVHSLEAYPSGLVGSWLASRINRPYILTVHGTYGVQWYNHLPDRWVYARVLRSAARVNPVSQGTGEILQRYFGSALQGVPVVPVLNGNEYHLRMPAEYAQERTLPPIPTLLSVGDVKRRKGLHTSLAAFALVKNALPNARYWIVGRCQTNEYFRSLQAMIKDYALQDVVFWGAVSDEQVQRCYKETSVFVLTPEQVGLQFEGFGLVYLEAGAYGLPVVGTRSGGVPDAVVDGETGFLAAEGDVDGVAQAILRLLGDADLAQRMGRANRRRAELLSWERAAADQMRQYQFVLGVR